MKYTKEQTELMITEYLDNPSRTTIDILAEKFDRSIKSIIGKLSKEGVYRKEIYVSKSGDKPITKLEIVSQIEDELGIDLPGLDKAPKETLKTLMNTIV